MQRKERERNVGNKNTASYEKEELEMGDEAAWKQKRPFLRLGPNSFVTAAAASPSKGINGAAAFKSNAIIIFHREKGVEGIK